MSRNYVSMYVFMYVCMYVLTLRLVALITNRIMMRRRVVSRLRRSGKCSAPARRGAFYMCVCLFVYMRVCLFVYIEGGMMGMLYMFVHLFVSMCVRLFVYMCVNLFVKRCICSFVRIYVCSCVRGGEWLGRKHFLVTGAVAISKNRAGSRTYPERGALPRAKHSKVKKNNAAITAL